MQLDAIDRIIVKRWREGVSRVGIASLCGMTETGIRARIEKLHRAGLIELRDAKRRGPRTTRKTRKVATRFVPPPADDGHKEALRRLKEQTDEHRPVFAGQKETTA